MKKLLLFLFVALIGVTWSYAQGVKVVAAYNYPTNDKILDGLNSIRCVNYAADPFGDGTPAIVATDYYDQGHVCVFIPVGQDSLKLVWTSPTVTSGGGGSTPRYALFGDLDNDGLVEIICGSQNNGIYIYQWDGVAGSYNFGDKPSQVINPTTTNPPMQATDGNIEYMECTDVDGDGQNELLVAYNGASNATDGYYIFSASGTWTTGDPGFSSFNVEYYGAREALGAWGLSGGTPYSMITADFLGNGKKEILINNWNHNNVTMLNVTGPDSYKLADTTNGKQNYMLGGSIDEVALFGGMAFDVDGDGRQEVYLPTYPGQDPSGGYPHTGYVHMISYNQGQSTTEIDSSNDFVLNLSSLMKTGYAVFGYGYGDMDGNGKPNLYFSSSYPYNIMSAEYEGGNKKDMNNWKLSVLYPGDTTIYSDITVKDSSGSIDSVKTVQNAFASKFYDHYTHLFKNDHEDMILPYQAINDSITVTNLTWNSTSKAYDTTSSTKILNPKRWGLRVIEGSAVTGISVKDVTVITPHDYVLQQNYPNPFNPSTTVKFSIPVKSNITLKIFDMLGQEVKTLVTNEVYSSGSHQVVWDGSNNFGSKVASGNYICQIRFGNFTKSIKMTLLK